jgi:uncharacterized protein (UPF0332 family)
MNNAERCSELVRYWWSKAEESLASAKRELEAESYSITMNRLYYAAFYGVCAALFERGLSFRKHSGVRSAFHREFIRTALLEVKYGKFYDQLFEDRQEGDYIAFVSFEPDYVEHQLNQCIEFFDNLRAMISLLAK